MMNIQDELDKLIEEIQYYPKRNKIKAVADVIISHDGRVISWHISQVLGIKTAQVNYYMKQMAKEGMYDYKSYPYCIIYQPPTKNN